MIERRAVLRAGACVGWAVYAQPVLGAPPDLSAAIAKFAKTAPVRVGKVTLDVAELVDNGNTVPLRVSVASAMTPDDHVLAIALFNEKNPQREVALFRLGPWAGRAIVQARIRLATSQKIVAVAHMSDGSFWSQTVDVIVTLAACIEEPI